MACVANLPRGEGRQDLVQLERPCRMFAIVLNVNKNVADWEVSKLTLLDVQQQVGWGVKCCCLRLRLLQRVFRFSGVFCGGILFHFSGLLIEAMSPGLFSMML